ncbi:MULTISPECIES: helix-turn-helix transcriptional regulator [unclassified Mycobacterium]|uniref:helix-turn-helix domain-containing protein n=1 Tax=unclassified Mycobacterium TaxID=2642494 RepID=UPI0029C6D179|nr:MULTISPECIES: helix-turn-helix transcriptional regulator [unclassified Mycobacterium]
MGYRESPPPAPLRDLVECAWVGASSGPAIQVLPDGCMDLIRMDDLIVVAGPDTTPVLAGRPARPYVGLRFRPGVLPRLLGVPAAELAGSRVPLAELRAVPPGRSTLTELAVALASEPPTAQTAPWSLDALHHVTGRLAAGAPVPEVAEAIGWSPRTLQRQCSAVYGYGPTTLRRVLRFRRAVAMLRAGRSIADVAANAGYADQSHLHREVREFAGTAVTTLAGGYPSAANRSTAVPSGSATVA